MLKVANRIVVAMCCVFAAMLCGCEDVVVEVIKSNAYLRTEVVKGDSKNCAVVLEAQQGTSYSVSIASEGDWAKFSTENTVTEGVMESKTKVVYIYFSKNASGESRVANVDVVLGGETFLLSFKQESYDSTIAFVRDWAELPVCKEENNYIYNTHYGEMGSKTNARNYTYCFDPKVRASLWVAYPLHKCYTSGSGNRNNSSFGFDPKVDDELQANLGRGSYNGWYDRGHQLPAADRKCSQQMMDQTFYATNMTPQQYNFNQNKWGALEGRVRNMICSDTLYVVTGAYFEGEHDSSIDSKTTDKSGNNCPTPTYYYKALLRTKKGNTGKSISEIDDAAQLRAIVFWMEHTNTGEDTNITASDCISVAELEAKIGFTLFPMLNDAIEQEVKAAAVPSEWGVN
ncbi:MAG: DNA/RNA non-specific endonuclease [Alistipes sp.]|nr:DNA/RNA non-specific endonuclease [Alistipes sp.]